MAVTRTRIVTRWVTRVIPLLLFGAIFFSFYVTVARVCLDYFIGRENERNTAVAFLVPSAILLFLLVTTYLRLILVIILDPGVVPLGPKAEHDRSEKQQTTGSDVEAQRYDGGPDTDPDSPGLEKFYTKDVFVCQDDGRPRWCSSCRNWKPDRAHHSREINRCVRKMDHFCPWVGGIVSETSFKFFIQFVFYAALYCGVTLGAVAYTLKRQIRTLDGLIDGMVIGVIALAAFFGLFTFLMTVTSMRYVFINLTNVDVIRQKHMVHMLAIRVPPHTPAPNSTYGIITYPLVRAAEALPTSPRDLQATRVFAIVKTEMGENPWDLGTFGNWKAVMGTNVLDWLLPIRQSPCVDHESSESEYKLGRLYPELRSRYGLPELSQEMEGVEMRNLRRA